MTSLESLMMNAADELNSSIRSSRAAFAHNLNKGEAVESAVREFFRLHYPSTVGVARGQVVDRFGGSSRQLDVILYDNARTPVLFTDRQNDLRLIPSEGVIAAVESKTSLQHSDLPELVHSAQVLKSLDRSSYYSSDGPIIRTQSAFGEQWSVMPPLYFVMAFDSPDLAKVAGRLNELQKGSAPHQRVDMICSLNRGVVLNTSGDNAVDGAPSRNSWLAGYDTTKALLLFHVLASRYILQSSRPPISIQSYLPETFHP